MTKLDFIKENFLDKGLKVFPAIKNKKTPLIQEWQKECSNDFLQVAYWLESAKDCNIGLPANENNLFIIDIDMHGDVNGMVSFDSLLNDLKLDYSDVETLMQVTPSGGVHFIFESDEELKEVINSANCFENYPGIDIRTKGYILVQPSVIDGKEYILDNGELHTMHPKLREFILNNNKQYEIDHKDYVKPEKVEKGGRDTALFDYLNQLYYKTKLNKEEILLLAYHFNENICTPSLSKSVVDYKVNKLFKKQRSKFVIFYLGEENGDIKE